MMFARLSLVAVVVGAVVLLASCGGSSEKPPPPEDTGTATPAAGLEGETRPARSPTPNSTTTAGVNDSDCEPDLQHEAGDFDGAITSDGMERTYILHVPPSYDGTSAMPLVINYHGFGSNARDQALYSRFPQKADEEGFIVVSPNGTGRRRAGPSRGWVMWTRRRSQPT